MFDNVRIPIKLKKSPIKQAIIEIRYNGTYIEAALYGLLIDVFSKFEKHNIQQTPFLQLPQELRENDPNLKYQATYQGIQMSDTNGKYVFGIGAHVITFSVLDTYTTWSDWTKFFEPILKTVNYSLMTTSP